jgi:phage anti-repressor protein
MLLGSPLQAWASNRHQPLEFRPSARYHGESSERSKPCSRRIDFGSRAAYAEPELTPLTNTCHADWVKDALEAAGAEESRDFWTILQKENRQTWKDYTLTVETAKHIAMMHRGPFEPQSRRHGQRRVRARVSASREAPHGGEPSVNATVH